MLAIRTQSREDVVELTDMVSEQITASGVTDGMCFVSVLHTSCGLVIQENDGRLPNDLHTTLDRLVPWEGKYTHNVHDDNAAAHIKAALLGNSVQIPIADGKAVLGTWQRILLFEFDGPRERNVHVKIVDCA